jgi:hypothetical protein
MFSLQLSSGWVANPAYPRYATHANSPTLPPCVVSCLQRATSRGAEQDGVHFALTNLLARK